MITKLLFSIALFTIPTTYLQAQSWNQTGPDMDGEASGNYCGFSISMPESNIIAVGASYNDGNGFNSGHVRIYAWIGSAWVQKGTDIDGEAAGDESGISVSMPDSNTLAIGARVNSGNGSFSGHVRIYVWNGIAWVQKGVDLDGEAANDQSGISVSMPDNNTVAIGAPYNDGNGIDAGHVRIYTWNGIAWVQKGVDLDGEAANDRSGISVNMPDSNTVAIGAPKNDGNGIDAGHVRIFSWNGSVWVQKGTDMDGEAAGDESGQSVSMPDSNTVAIGAPFNDGSSFWIGQARIYSWNGSSWVQKGTDIDGEAYMDRSGHSIDMSDSNTVAIGAPFNDGNGSAAGHVRIYSWNGSVWVQKGIDIDGEAVDDESGCSVSLPDSNTVSIGAYRNSGNGSFAGHVRVFSFATVSLVYDPFESVVTIFPNPANKQLQIDLAKVYQDVVVAFKNMLGQEVSKQVFANARRMQLDMPAAAGYYLVEITAGERRVVFKVIKNEQD